MKTPEIKLNKIIFDSKKKCSNIHPWFFSRAISNEPKDLKPGSLVKILDSVGSFVGYGHYNPLSSIRARVISFKEDEIPNTNFLENKISQAYAQRKNLNINSDSFRVVFSESDGLPGLVIDKFYDYAVIQTNTAGMDKMKTELASIIARVCEVSGVVERNDCEIRKLEGLSVSKGVLFGKEPPNEILINENGLKFAVSLLNGQKTGFFLDQRENRMAVANFAKPGMRILDAFCFSGGFGTYCAERGVSSIHILDESEDSLALAKKNLDLNGFANIDLKSHRGDAFSILRTFRDSRIDFDIIVLDPPKFAPTIKDADKAERGYKDINLLGIKLVRDGGFLATFSCSSGISRERFRQILERAARDSCRKVAILATLGQPADHPISLSFPESEYLKGYILRIGG